MKLNVFGTSENHIPRGKRPNPPRYLDFSQFENQIQRDNTFYIVQFMDQSLEQRDSNKRLGDAEMQKVADAADISVLFFSASAIFLESNV